MKTKEFILWIKVIFSLVSLIALIMTMKILVDFLNLLSFVLNRAIENGMSDELSLILILASLYLFSNVAGIILGFILKMIKKEEKK